MIIGDGMASGTKTIEDTELEIAAQDPLHTEEGVARASYTLMDHFSHFSGLAVAQFYIISAFITLYEVVARYVFNAPTQ